tara:strand:- start:161 stop:1969 length:1809 start_codon:yes stop_codon:yes gene_type:complete
MIQGISFFRNSQIKKILIFSLVSGFAIQALLLIVTLGHDIPLADDGDQLFIAYLIENNYEITLDDFFNVHNGHIPLFIRLVSIPLLLTFSFTSMPIFYFQWAILCISIIVTYYLLKQTNEKYTWLIIPISLLIFNPLEEYPLTWVLGGLQQTLPLVSFIIIIFLLTKKTITLPKITLALFFVAVAMFSNQAALFFWPIMILSFIKKENKKKWLTIWIAGGIFLSILFFTQIVGGDCKFGGGCEGNIIENAITSLTNDGKIYAFFFSIASISFRLKFDAFYITVGAIMIITLVTGLFYTLYNKEKLSSLIPWVQYGLVGLVYVSLLTIGRFHAWNGQGVYIDTYYIPLTSLIPIGLIVLTTGLFSYWKSKTTENKRRWLNFLLILLIISVVIMLIPSHILGWKIGQEQYDWKENNFVGCLRLPANTQNYDSLEYCSESFIPYYLQTFSDRQKFAPEIWNFFLKNNYNIFANEKFNETETMELLEFSKELERIQNTSIFDGKIEKINSKMIKNNEVYEIDDFQIIIQGSIKNIDIIDEKNIYLFLDNEPFSRILDLDDSQDDQISWNVIFLSGYVPLGCHELSFGFIQDGFYYISSDNANFCRV